MRWPLLCSTRRDEQTRVLLTCHDDDCWRLLLPVHSFGLHEAHVLLIPWAHSEPGLHGLRFQCRPTTCCGASRAMGPRWVLSRKGGSTGLSDGARDTKNKKKYIQDLITRSSITNNQTTTTPMDLYLQLRPTDDTPLEDPSRYRHIVGNLVYLTVIRPDIAHVVHILSQFV